MNVLEVLRFLRGTRDYVSPEKATLHQAGDQAIAHAAYHRVIVRVSVLFGFLGAVVGLAFTVGLVVESQWSQAAPAEAGSVQAAQEGMELAHVLVLIPLGLTAVGLMVGAGAACLFAPAEFLTGPLGRKWMKLIGTRNVSTARAVCFLLLLLSLGAAAGIVAMSCWQILSRMP